MPKKSKGRIQRWILSATDCKIIIEGRISLSGLLGLLHSSKFDTSSRDVFPTVSQTLNVRNYFCNDIWWYVTIFPTYGLASQWLPQCSESNRNQWATLQHRVADFTFLFFLTKHNDKVVVRVQLSCGRHTHPLVHLTGSRSGVDLLQTHYLQTQHAAEVEVKTKCTPYWIECVCCYFNLFFL